MKQFTAIFQKTDSWWIGSVAEVPGVNTQGSTLDETRKNLKEALTMLLQTNREIAIKEALGKKVILEKISV